MQLGSVTLDRGFPYFCLVACSGAYIDFNQVLFLLQEVSEAAAEKDSLEKNALRITQYELAKYVIYLHGRMQLHMWKLAKRITEKQEEGESCFRTIKANLSSLLLDLEKAMKEAHAASVPENLQYANIHAVKANLDQASNIPCHFVRCNTKAR